MCEFFTCVSDGKGKLYYFNWLQRKKILKGELKDKAGNLYEADSHSSVIKFIQEKTKYIGNDFEEKFNKYEYNPLTKVFKIDKISVKDDSKIVEKLCKKLDFSKIVKPLIIKKMINPIKLKNKKIYKADINLLKEWDSVWDSVRDSVWASVRDSVSASVWASVWASVRDSVWDSVRDSVGDSVWDSVRDSVSAYISSFFNIKKYKYIDKHNSYNCLIKLWTKGLVPSFDGTTWRLHGYKGQIVWEDKKHEIKQPE